MKTILKILALGLFLFSDPALAQLPKQTYDSLMSEWNNVNNPDTSRLNALRAIANSKGRTELDSAIIYGQLLYDFASKSNAERYMGDARKIIGSAKIYKGDYAGALEGYEEAIKLYGNVGYLKGQAVAYSNTGIIYRRTGETNKAKEYYLKAAEIAEKGDFKKIQGDAYSNLGNVCDDLGEYAQAIDYHTKSLKIREALGSKHGMAICYINIGIMHNDQEDFDQAKEYFEKSLALFREVGDKWGAVYNLMNIGGIYLHREEYDSALSKYQESLKLEQELGTSQLISSNTMNIGSVYFNLKDYQKAEKYIVKSLQMTRDEEYQEGVILNLINMGRLRLAQKQYSGAIRYLNEAKDLAIESATIREVANAYQYLYETYKEMGSSSKALAMYEQHVLFKDSLRNIKIEKDILRKELEYNFEKEAFADSLQAAETVRVKEAELKAEQAISSRRTQQTYFLIAGLALALALGGFAYNRYQVANKQKEVIQEQADKLEELAEFRTNFFTNITHEFRTPLTVIQGVAQNIDSNKEEVEMIQRNSKRLLDLITQILDLSKLESGKLEVNYKQMDASALLSYFTNSFKSLADVNKQSLELDLPSEELWMDVDEEKLQTLMNNLLSNAFKFTPEGGTISVHARKKGKELEVQVKDSGSGIPDSELDKVFDRFYQVQGREARKIGSGVGLALSKEILRVLGGDISASNNTDKGASFSFTLPIKQEHERASISVGTEDKADTAAVDPVSENGIDSDKPLVLVVEDEADIRTFVKGCLEGQFSVLLAENGEQGVEMAIEKVPDLIISDVMMPVKDGLQLTDELKNDSRTSHIPIVILSAKADLGSRLEGLKRGAEIYLPKPFEKKELLLHLENLLKLREKLQAYYAGGQGEAPPEEEQKIEHEFLTQIKEYLEEHLDDSNYGITELCSDMALSRMQLHRKLKALTGQAASDYLNAYKLEQAKEMLLNKDLNISEIAYSVGYSDPGYFTRIFNKKYGKSPSDFRSEA